jgi:hypothetical protein
MALRPLQAGKDPLGQFDGYDLDYLTLKGGEVGTFILIPDGQTDLHAYDVIDGYVSNPNAGRVAVTHTLTGRSGARPLMLLDEGTFGYGTMFGTALGGVTGQIVPNPTSPATTGGIALGPHTGWGSGKVTCWDKPGLYAVTLDAVAADLAPTTALLPGAPLYATNDGLLTSDAGSAFEVIAVARFVEFTSNGSYVTTQPYMAGGAKTYTQVVIHFNGAM